MTLPSHAQNPGSAVTLFDNGEFRVELLPDGRGGYRVLAPAVARQLGYRDAARMLDTVPAGEKGYTLASTPGGEQRVSYLTEGGFYRVLGQRHASRVTNEDTRALVERFQSWVFNDVLPALRRGELVAARPASAELSPKEQALLLARALLDAEQRASDAINRAEVSEAALEAAAPAIEYVERYVDKSQVVLIDKWAAGYGLTGPQARKLLVDRNIIYRSRVGWRWSDSKQRMVEEFEYRARAGRVTFDWFDLRPQHNAPLMHNGQLRHTLYVRQAYALELGRKVGLAPVAGTDVVLRDGAA